MKIVFRMLVAIACLPITLLANEPVALGNWRIHLPYQNVKAICETHTYVYCAGEHGLFSFNKIDASVERLSPINGFSSYQVQAMAYEWSSKTLVIAYDDSRIEIIKDKQIEKNDDIFRKTIVGEKKINHIQISHGIAYISTSFGLLELNLLKNEIKNSYLNIGPGGSVIEIYSSALAYDSLFISTKTGIYKGSTNQAVNLADFNSWQLSYAATKHAKHVAAFNDMLFAEVDSQMLQYKNKRWQIIDSSKNKLITNIQVNHNVLVAGVYGKHIFQEDLTGNRSYQPVSILNQCLRDAVGNLCYATPSNGLEYIVQGNIISFYPNGPRANTAYQFLNAYGNLWVMGGSFVNTTYAPTFNRAYYYTFDNFEWTNSPSYPLIMPLYDYTVASYQKSTGKVYIGSHGKGILQINNGIPFQVFDETNSPLKQRDSTYTIVSGLASDSKNNLWISNFDADSALHQLSASGVWTSYKLPTQNTGKIIIDSKNRKWILTPKSGFGFLAFDDNGSSNPTDDIVRLAGTSKGNGNLPSPNVNDFAFTKSGELLIGTDQGYVRMRNPNNIFTGGDFDAQRVIVSVEANSNLGGYLLGSEIINCIVVDGGDRRWFGTNKGVWLYDSDGETLIHHFTTDNSPLMSDNVLSIGIMDATGEVFFGTDKGMASFRSNALNPTKNLGELLIYPNPVKPDYQGDISINGMPDNTLVKITDINGGLVNQTFSNGGMATWNGKNFDGVRVSTGVYLVFCINTEGSETAVGKILFIH